jgi:hypothetical protein
MLNSDLIVYIAIGLSMIIPLVIAWRGGGFMRIFFATWLSFILFSVFVDFIVPIIAKLLGEQDAYRPADVPATLMAVFGGWVYGLIFGGITLLVRRIFKSKD